MALSVPDAKKKIDRIFAKYQKAGGSTTTSLLQMPPTLKAGKVYEAWVLVKVIEGLESEGYTAKLRNSAKVRLRSTPGEIDRGYSHFELDHATEAPLEVWTDVEFLTLSYAHRNPPYPGRGDYHELDVLVLPAGLSGRPAHDDIVIGVECKATPYTKALLRAILGVRRELSMLTMPPLPTRFTTWPSATVPAQPESCLLTYCTSAKVNQLDSAGDTFGIGFVNEPAP